MSFVHSQIIANLTRALGNLVLDGPCIVLLSDMDMKVRIPLPTGDVHPDVSLICGRPQFVGEFVGDATDVLTNPQVVVEVLSDSTESMDRGDEFAGYRSLPSLADYLLVAQDQARVEHYSDPARGCGSRGCPES